MTAPRPADRIEQSATRDRVRRGSDRPEVLVAMSGGVDSSVAAALLLAQGYRVIGVTMKLWGGPSDSGCCSVTDVDDARRVAHQLGIEHHVFNFGDDFERHVVGPYVAAHAAGQTPNPCVECNRHLKFDRLLRRASMLGIELVATGHHAAIVTDPVTGVRHVARGADRAKDQSYVLAMLGQEQLARLLFPLGDRTKAEVRAIAASAGLRTAAKPDSQDVCFITAGGRADFLAARLELHPGRVIDTQGNEVGRVPAVELVTIGQRKGLGGAGGTQEPRFAVEVDVAGATVTIGRRHDLDRSEVALAELTWAAGPVTGPVRAQVSAHGDAAPATLEHLATARDGSAPGPRGEGAQVGATDQDGVDDRAPARLTWVTPRRRVAPGQTVVFYDFADGRIVLGSAVAR